MGSHPELPEFPAHLAEQLGDTDPLSTARSLHGAGANVGAALSARLGRADPVAAVPWGLLPQTVGHARGALPMVVRRRRVAERQGRMPGALALRMGRAPLPAPIDLERILQTMPAVSKYPETGR